MPRDTDTTAEIGQPQGAVEIAAESMSGDIRNAIVGYCRDNMRDKPWSQLTEDEQSRIITGAEYVARGIITRTVNVVAADEYPVIKGTLEQATAKDGIKAVVTLSKSDEQRHALIDAVGGVVLILLCDSDKYLGQRAPLEPDPEQPDLPVFDGAATGAPDHKAA